MRLQGNKILITGATSGIGRVMAIRFLSLDNQVIAVGRNATQLARLQLEHPQLVTYRCDLAVLTEREKLAAFVDQHHPDLNVLVNNAGVQYNYELTEADVLRIAEEIEINLTAPLQLAALLLPQLRRQPAAAIVNVSSGLGLVPKRSAPVYCATKAGLHLFSKALGYQLAATQVRVMEVIPPLVDTPMTAGRGTGKISPERDR
ncbi:MAG: SDR family NAD(P)-dependent oxidoreductase [Bernardetiaceae bacterium]|nr:SDR family NAD(P)-dependent oxidoreductase [Bernardetiaceae bacterium]